MGRSLAPSPLARYLLDLAEQEADGHIDIGGRTLTLRQGRVVDVTAARGDRSFADFLERAGRLTPEQAGRLHRETDRGDSSIVAELVQRRWLSSDIIGQARKAMWLDRLVRGIAEEDGSGREPPILTPDAPDGREGDGEDLAPVLLSALERRAASGDAEAIGARARDRFTWASHPVREQAARWAQLGDLSTQPRVADILARTPAAACRIAALVRAGIARVVSPHDSAPPPPERPASIAPPPPRDRPSIPAPAPGPERAGAASSRGTVHSDDGSAASATRETPNPASPAPEVHAPHPSREVALSAAPAEASQRPAPRDRGGSEDSTDETDPGADPGPEEGYHDDLGASLGDRLPPMVAPLADPLDEGERQLATLEQAAAPGQERAAVWRRLARIWQSHYGSMFEAARCLREAAAADPRDVTSLSGAAALCAAMDRLDLARAYADAALSVAQGNGRRQALRLRPDLAIRGGQTAAYAEQLSALAEETGDPEAHERLAWFHWEQGDDAAARSHAIAASARLTHQRPDRARALLAEAHGRYRDDSEISRALVTALIADGFAGAAVAMLLRQALCDPDMDTRRQRLLDAAERAEQAELPYAAANALLEAFDAEPGLSAIYDPLVDDLERAGLDAERAVVLEEIACACEPEARAQWLLLAANAYGKLAAGSDWSVELLTRALVLEPQSDTLRAAIRGISDNERDPSIFADALERAARRAIEALRAEERLGHGAGTAARIGSIVGLLRELATLAEERLGAAPRAIWAHDKVLELFPDDRDAAAATQRLAERSRVKRELIGLAEADLGQAVGPGRAHAARRLAGLLADHPDERPRLVELYYDALEAAPDDAALGSALGRVLFIVGDEAAQAALLRFRVGHTRSRNEQIHLLARLAGVEALRGAYRASAEACASLLDIAPQHDEAIARYERAARRLGDQALLRDALRRRLHATNGVERRGQIHAQMALRWESTGDTEQALIEASQALELDPRNADAALVALANLTAAPPGHGHRLLLCCRRALGDSPPLLEKVYEYAAAAPTVETGDEDADGVLATWGRLAPFDTRPVLARIGLAGRNGDATALSAALDDAIALPSFGGLTTEIVAQGLRQLAACTSAAATVPMALRALDRRGNLEGELLPLVLGMAEQSGKPEHRLAAIERAIAFSTKEERVVPLKRLALLHKHLGNRAAEARSLLRMLAVAPNDGFALGRLRRVYAETGELTRLSAVLSLELRLAKDAPTRRERLLDLAAVAWIEGDVERAAAFTWTMAEAAGDDEDALLAAANHLVSVGRPMAAAELLGAAANRASEERAGALYERAAAIAEHDAYDAELALSTTVRGLERVPSHAPLLLAFERLALRLGDVATATETYEHLEATAWGNHGRRAILYRKARWLERAGEHVGALEALVAAFRLSPSEGAVLSELGRLAEQLAAWEPLVDALLLLAAATPTVERRLALAHRGATICESELNDKQRSFTILLDAWQETGSWEAFVELRRLCRAIGDSDAGAAAEAFAPLVEGLRVRASKAWDGATKMQQLMLIAEIYADDLDAVDHAAAIVEEALELAEREDVEAINRAEALCRLAEWLGSRTDRVAFARARAEMAVSLCPQLEQARVLCLRFGGVIPHPPTAATDSGDRKPSGDGAARVTPDATPNDAAALPNDAAALPNDAAALPDERAPSASRDAAGPSDESPAPPAEPPSSHDESPAPPAEPPASPAELAPGATHDAAGPPDESPAPPAEPPASHDESPAPPAEPPGSPDEIAPVASDGIAAATAGASSLENETADSTEIDLPTASEPPPAWGAGAARPEQAPPAGVVAVPIARAPADAAPSLRDRAAHGDLDALEALGIALCREPETLHEGEEVLLSTLRADPTRLAALRSLRRVAADLDDSDLAQVCEEVLATATGKGTPATPAAFAVGPEAGAIEGALTMARNTPTERMTAPLALLWEHAGKLFRQSLKDHDVVGTDRIASHGKRPVSRELGVTQRLLGIDDVSLFIRSDGSGPDELALKVIATQPPSLIGSVVLDTRTPAALRFLLAHGLELARSPHVLLATLSDARGRTVIEAINAAFGSAISAEAAALDPKAALLAAELYGTLPSRTQADLHAALADVGPLSFDALRQGVLVTAARVALLATGAVQPACVTLLELEGRDPTLESETDFRRACTESATLRAMVAFAFSDAFMASRSRAKAA